ncbi:cell division protein FtsQ [Methylomarinovum tepidoasis]|uniref:Cell division protein FtsQ n=1 Tax=Methylomarinovum tepidoasis TaxID=2840183 RepID=A0AAU9C853_9GAMM|nr:cell division protein FtsQ/DivIB [Methylomarinovum sp. IN45]BCX88016.1 cell division protein FtsQ [Methylomarinovum sp. IN45]
MSRAKTVLWGLALIGMMGAMVERMREMDSGPPQVRIVGPLRHVRMAALKEAVVPHLRGYWGTDLTAVAAAVRRLPWVAAARAERIWPRTFQIELREQRPVVRWGNASLLNARGEKFTPADDVREYAGLPLLSGPEGYESRLLTAYRCMGAALAPLGWHIVRLQVDSRRSWRLETREGMTLVLGRVRPEAAFEGVARALGQLTADVRRRIGYVDARYNHGFALRLREPATEVKHTQAQHG